MGVANFNSITHFQALINIPLDRNAKGDYDYINNINKPLKRR